MQLGKASFLFAIILCFMPLLSQGQNMGSTTNQAPNFADPSVKVTLLLLGRGVPGKLYEPVTKGDKTQIGVFVMHNSGDYLNFSACGELSKRGYTVLCANNSTAAAGENANIEAVLQDVKLGVAYLRKYPGIRKVVLFGHSGGGAMMSAYQNIAENGLPACQGPEKLYKCSKQVAELPPADGIMLVDANWGLSTMTLFSLDAAVVSEDDGIKTNPDLNLFDPKVGYAPAPSGADYSQQFIHNYQAAQGKRMNRLIQTAQERLAAIEAGKGHYADDEPFVVPGANMGIQDNRLFSEDIHLMSHTRKAWPLLLPDGSISNQVVHSVRVPENTSTHTESFRGSAAETTVRNFLETLAIRVTDDFGYDDTSVHGIDWSSSNTATPGNVRGIKVPLLTMGMTGHWEYLAAETIYENAESTDKSIAFVQGAQHTYIPCTKCEKTPGEFGDTIKTLYDYADSWLSKPGRF